MVFTTSMEAFSLTLFEDMYALVCLKQEGNHTCSTCKNVTHSSYTMRWYSYESSAHFFRNNRLYKDFVLRD